MIEMLTIFFLKYLLLSPLIGFSTIYGVIGFSKAFNFSIEKMSKSKVGLLFTLLYISIYVCYKNPFLFSPVGEACKEILFSIAFGSLWAWLFLELIEAIGFRFQNVNKFYLSCLFAIIAFGIFTLMK